jgi:hypothetical protein
MQTDSKIVSISRTVISFHGFMVDADVRLDIVHVVPLIVGFIEKSQSRIAVPKVCQILCDKGSQFLKIAFYAITTKSSVIVTLVRQEIKPLKSLKIHR